jgi:hypothetical protein
MSTMKSVAIGVTLLTAVGSASADGKAEFSQGFYVSAGAGPSEYTYDDGFVLADNGYSLGLGYDVNPYLSAEVQYLNIYDITFGAENFSGNGLVFRGIAKLPMESAFTPFVGVAYTSGSESYTYNGVTYDEQKGSVTGATFGFEFALTDEISARVISDSYSNNGVDVTITHVGIVARF